MFRNSQGFAHGEAAPSTGEARLRWLKGTRQLDVMSPKLIHRTNIIASFARTQREKAVALHDFVQSLPFGCVGDYSELTAEGVLKLGYGDCFSKGMLFVAMLRCAGVPARLRFVTLPTHFLRGIVEPGESSIMHAMAEVLLDERWVVTDSYVPDRALFVAAHKKLQAEQQTMGYGIHVDGTHTWQGLHDASAQCEASDPRSLPTQDWGVAHDPESFYADPSHSPLRRNFATRLKWRLGAPVVNKRAAALRNSV